MVYIAGADHLPVKFLPPRQLIGPRPPVPPIPIANFFTLGRMMMQSAFATTLAGTSLLATIACNTVAALRRVCSSSVLSAALAGRAKIRNRYVSKQDTGIDVRGIGFNLPLPRLVTNQIKLTGISFSTSKTSPLYTPSPICDIEKRCFIAVPPAVGYPHRNHP